MSDDEVDEELLELLRKSMGIGGNDAPRPAKTGVLEDAEYVYNNATDVALDMRGTKTAAASVWSLIQQKDYSTRDWSRHELHPKAKDESTVEFIFLMDLINFSFWSENDAVDQRFAVEYRGRRWTGYWSLVAAMQRALEEGIPVTSPGFWINEVACTDELLRHVFRSATDEDMPLLEDRMYCMREAGYVLHSIFDGSFINCINEVNGSAAALVNLLADNFPCLDDRHYFEDTVVRIHKRAQILVADLWACFEDYRIPQMLHSLGCLQYSPTLENHIRKLRLIPSGHSWELQLRGCSIWCVELIRREIYRSHPDSQVNAILIDFLLYDTVKELEAAAHDCIAHHRTRSIWY